MIPSKGVEVTAMNRFVMVGTALRAAVCAAVVLVPAGAQLAAQQSDDWCREERSDNERDRFCEVRELTVAATSGTLNVRGTNGGISVEGEARSNVRILAKVVATAEDPGRAQQIVKAVQLNPTLEQVEATGPTGLGRREGWSVSYRLSVPRALNLSLHTSNGGISIRDVDANVAFQTTNGGVKLANLAGDVKGQTTNGGVDIELDGPAWMGEGLDVETTNGGVKLSIPQNYSARLEASTENGGFNIDVPGASVNRRTRDINVQLGSGGAPIRVRTSNGGVRVTRK
jgi:hypothetical protein